MDEEKLFLKVEKRGLFYVLGGALSALAFLSLGKILEKGKGKLVTLAKEGIAFKEWVGAKTDELKETVEDIIAEAKYLYVEEQEELSQILRREKELLESLEKQLAKKRETSETERKGGKDEGKEG